MNTPRSKLRDINKTVPVLLMHCKQRGMITLLTSLGQNTKFCFAFCSSLAKIKIPELFGDKIFVVEDRMQKRFASRIDIWMPSKAKALRFGKVSAEIKILD